MDIISYALSKGNTQKAVTDYLDEHLTNPTNPPIDTSLSIAGAAADSKKLETLLHLSHFTSMRMVN